jgi:hypothetical protein
MRVTALAAMALLSACQTTPRGPVPRALELTSSAPLQLEPGCQPQGSVIVEFTVQPDGATSGIQTPVAPDCLQNALTAWVASFRYAPPGESVPSSVEWLLVTARKGS